MAKQIATAFYAFEAAGKSLDECFALTAEQFGIDRDEVVDALNEAAFS
jgi:phage-related minor tail protein